MLYCTSIPTVLLLFTIVSFFLCIHNFAQNRTKHKNKNTQCQFEFMRKVYTLMDINLMRSAFAKSDEWNYSMLRYIDGGICHPKTIRYTGIIFSHFPNSTTFSLFSQCYTFHSGNRLLCALSSVVRHVSMYAYVYVLQTNNVYIWMYL